MYMHGFLPAVYQPTMFRPGDRPVLQPRPARRASIAATAAARRVELIRELNEATLDPADEELAARISAYDLAFKMQTEAPEVFDLSRETQETLDLYGIGSEPTDDYGRRCLLARQAGRAGRAVRRASSPAAGRATCSGTPTATSRRTTCARPAETDQPVAGLLTDLKRRGLLDSTLVLWGGEFGRSPEAAVAARAATTTTWASRCGWPAAACKGGQVVGATDAIGLHADREAATTSATSTPRSCTSSASTSTS